MNQLELHKRIDALLLKNPTDARQEKVSDLISRNPDAYQYFFAGADERWLDWLWRNGFLDVIRQKAKDLTHYSYKTPELNYLVKVAEKRPEEVTNIILAVPISKKTFNPEVVNQFLRICSVLPVEQLTRIVQKIRDEKWIPLMGIFNCWGFEYEKMLKILVDAKEYKSILVLAEAILSVRTKKEMEKTTNRIATDNPFYFDDLSHTKVFEHLASIADKYAKKAFDLVTKIMTKVILLSGKSEGDSVFPVKEAFYLFDVDFFALEFGQEKHLSRRDGVRELAAIIKILTQKLIGDHCSEAKKIHNIYEKYIGDFDSSKAKLPDSRAVWRLRLFVLSLCPEVFKNELKKAFSRLFEVMKAGKPYYEIESGTEYKKALQKSFKVLGEKYQREYVQNVFTCFGKSHEDEKKEQWYKRDGWQILSSVYEYLTKEEHEKCKKIFRKKCDPEFEAELSIGKMQGGTVVPQGAITQEEFGNLPIDKIATNLRTDWAPKKLSKQNKGEDFLRPLNAEGVSEQLRADIPKRLQDYINSSKFFFERDVLDQHYTYSFLRGVQEVLREKKADASNINWNNLIALCAKIKNFGEAKPFSRSKRERDSFDVWLVGWDAVHSAIADLIQELFNERGGNISIDFKKYREQLFAIISYLLGYPDPLPEDERLETAKSKTKSQGDSDYLVSNPFTMAINTVRGRAFQNLVLFIYQDGKRFNKDDSVKIGKKVKKLYEKTLENENTRALMFMFGRYLPSFYFRDKSWMQNLLSQIFPTEPAKKYLYTAAWEGYLSTSLCRELFFKNDIQDLYKRGLTLTNEDYPKQKHFRDPDTGIAIHLALAFIYFSEFGFEHDLFKKFWKIENPGRHKEFISFIGRHCVSREYADLWIKENKVDIKKLKDFWNWTLEKNLKPEVLSGFGYWVNQKEEVLDDGIVIEKIFRTLEQSDGAVDCDYGLLKRLPVFAEKNGDKTLKIISSYLLDSNKNLNQNRRAPLLHQDEIKAAMEIVYKNGDTEIKKKIANLINMLIKKGSSMFWELKSILEKKSPNKK